MAHHIVAQQNVAVDLKMYGTGTDHTETTKDKKCCASNHFDYLNLGGNCSFLSRTTWPCN